MDIVKMKKTTTNEYEIPKRFEAGEVDKLTFALMKFGDQQIHAVLFADKHFEKELLKIAVRKMLDIEPVLGCKFIDDPNEPYWERREDLDNLSYFHFMKSKDFDNDLKEFVITPCDPRQDIPVQVKLFREEKRDIFCVKTSHAVMDGGALKEYIVKLSGIYNKLLTGINYNEKPNINGSRKLQQVLKHFNIFQKIWIFLRGMSSKPNWAFPWIGTSAKKPNYQILRFSVEKFRKIKKFGKKYSATINDMLLTAFYRAIFKILEPKARQPFMSVVTVNLRAYLPSKNGESLNNLSSSSYPEIRYKPNESFVETLERIRDEMNFRKKIAPGIGPAFFLQNVFRFKYSKVKKSIQKRYEKDLEKEATHPVFTNIGLIKTEDFNFDSINLVDGYAITPIMRAPGFIIGLITFNETMTLSMGYYEDSYDPSLVKSFFKLIADELTFKK